MADTCFETMDAGCWLLVGRYRLQLAAQQAEGWCRAFPWVLEPFRLSSLRFFLEEDGLCFFLTLCGAQSEQREAVRREANDNGASRRATRSAKRTAASRWR